MAIQIESAMSVSEYLEWEKRQEVRHEYIDGEIIEMTGGTRPHSEIMINLTLSIGRQLDDSPCRLQSSTMRVKVGQNRYVYPDLSAVCGEALMEDERELTLLNPILVVEITSPSSLVYDRVDKFGFYFGVPSIETFLIVDQDRVRADICTRTDEGWLVRVFNQPEDVIPLTAIECELPLAQVYRGIALARA